MGRTKVPTWVETRQRLNLDRRRGRLGRNRDLFSRARRDYRPRLPRGLVHPPDLQQAGKREGADGALPDVALDEKTQLVEHRRDVLRQPRRSGKRSHQPALGHRLLERGGLAGRGCRHVRSPRWCGESGWILRRHAGAKAEHDDRSHNVRRPTAANRHAGGLHRHRTDVPNSENGRGSKQSPTRRPRHRHRTAGPATIRYPRMTEGTVALKDCRAGATDEVAVVGPVSRRRAAPRRCAPPARGRRGTAGRWPQA